MASTSAVDNSASIDALFSAGSNSSAVLDNIAQRKLATGLDAYSAKNYDLAITNFKQVVGLSPGTTTAINAYDYMARAQLTQGNTDGAIASYQKALKIDPTRDDLHVRLGNIYTTAGRTDDASKEYQLAVKNNPTAANRYSLGQGYMATGQLDLAQAQFALVKQMTPKDPYGDFGVGQVYAKQGKYDAAIESFQAAIDKKPNYWNAYSEMGYALADSGNMSKAQDVADSLKANDATLSGNLSQYIYEQTKPQMTAVYASPIYGVFSSQLGPGTLVAGLNSYLLNANASQTFSMVFQFSKQMNPQSVENVYNWQIARATGTGRGDGYNLNMNPPASEVSMPPVPQAVYYDQQNMTATVLFKISQNAAANGTIDPSHINFSFNGNDVIGLSMDKSADMYSGFSGFA
jgi:tetratricopeptide (TPR) repeat protein